MLRPMEQTPTPALADDVASAVWYHTIELPDGTVTPGELDLRSAVAQVPIPASLAGKRCLDVGTRDGFWAFEMARRGADEVIGIDVEDTSRHDWPLPRPDLPPATREELAARDRCFDVARAALGAKAERRFVSVYDLSPDEVGTFDFAMIGTLLLHLRDPVGALMAIRSVLSPDAEFIVNESISLTLTLLRPGNPSATLFTYQAPFWWQPNRAGLRRYVEAAGFRIIEEGRPYRVPFGPGTTLPAEPSRQLLGGLRRRLRLRIGMPHVWFRVTPRTSV